MESALGTEPTGISIDQMVRRANARGNTMSHLTGYLTIFSADRGQIYGEFADAQWKSEMTPGGKSNIFSGTPGEGALKTFLQLDNEGISHVAYTFESSGNAYRGNAELLAPRVEEQPNHSQIQIETGETPAAE